MAEKLLSYPSIESTLKGVIAKSKGLEKVRLESALKVLQLSANLVTQNSYDMRESLEEQIYEILS